MNTTKKKLASLLCLVLSLTLVLSCFAYAAKRESKIMRAGGYKSPFDTADFFDRTSGDVHLQKLAASTGSMFQSLDSRRPILLENRSVADTKVTITDFMKDNIAIVISIIAAVALIILLLAFLTIRSEKNAREDRQLISAVELDDLTGLYNQTFFFEYANRIRREHPEKPMDAVVIDIEQFHSINELHGRTFGNQVLHALGEEICVFLSQAEGIGSRFDADRFHIFSSPQEDYQSVLDRFQKRLNQQFENARIRLRMGVMPWQEDMEVIRLFDRARTASGIVRGRQKHLMVYNELLEKKESLNQRLLNDVSRALRNHEFKVYYQPKYDIQSNPPRLNSAEAL